MVRSGFQFVARLHRRPIATHMQLSKMMFCMIFEIGFLVATTTAPHPCSKQV